MTEQNRSGETLPESGQAEVMRNDHIATAKLPTKGEAEKGGTEDRQPSKELTAEEQMALYEKDLKENDWGHQPC